MTTTEQKFLEVTKRNNSLELKIEGLRNKRLDIIDSLREIEKDIDDLESDYYASRTLAVNLGRKLGAE